MSTIADYIQHDLRSRVESGEGLPSRLTLKALADIYSVSLTPIRIAVDALLEAGVINKQENGRLEVAASKTRKRGRSPNPVSAPPNWEGQVLRILLLESLRGEAVFLREEALAEKLGIGRTLLRSVLGRLAGGGLLDHVPRCGWRIRPFREEDLEAYLEIRELLELKALELAWPNLEAEILRNMLEGNSSSGGRIDNRLHAYFLEKSGNRYLQDFFATSGRFYSALFDYAALGEDVLGPMATQHRQILQAALKQNWSEACQTLKDHIREQKPIVLTMIERLRREQKEFSAS